MHQVGGIPRLRPGAVLRSERSRGWTLKWLSPARSSTRGSSPRGGRATEPPRAPGRPQGSARDLMIVEAEASLVPDRHWLEDLGENLCHGSPVAAVGRLTLGGFFSATQTPPRPADDNGRRRGPSAERGGGRGVGFRGCPLAPCLAAPSIKSESEEPPFGRRARRASGCPVGAGASTGSGSALLRGRKSPALAALLGSRSPCHKHFGVRGYSVADRGRFRRRDAVRRRGRPVVLARPPADRPGRPAVPGHPRDRHIPGRRLPAEYDFTVAIYGGTFAGGVLLAAALGVPARRTGIDRLGGVPRGQRRPDHPLGLLCAALPARFWARRSSSSGS